MLSYCVDIYIKYYDRPAAIPQQVPPRQILIPYDLDQPEAFIQALSGELQTIGQEQQLAFDQRNDKILTLKQEIAILKTENAQLKATNQALQATQNNLTINVASSSSSSTLKVKK